jgi:hypothetical protein
VGVWRPYLGIEGDESLKEGVRTDSGKMREDVPPASPFVRQSKTRTTASDPPERTSSPPSLFTMPKADTDAVCALTLCTTRYSCPSSVPLIQTFTIPSLSPDTNASIPLINLTTVTCAVCPTSVW